MTDNPRLAPALALARRNKYSTCAAPAARDVRRVRRAAQVLLTYRHGTTETAPYDQKHTYEKSEKLWHPKYGRGIVTKVRGDKIAVRFGNTSKLLIHSRVAEGK